MDDKDNHWSEVIDMVKANNKLQYSNPEELDPQRTADLQKSVFSHIDAQFPNSVTESSDAAGLSGQASKSQPTSTFGALLNWLRERFRVSPLAVGIPAMAMVAVAMISIGLLKNNNTQLTNPYFDVPEVFSSANLDSHIQPVGSGSRALVATVSERKSAFITGIMQAELDLGGVSNEIVSANIVISYPDLFKNITNPSAETILNEFQSKVVKTNSDNEHSLWFKEGYKIEMAYLSAESALATFNTDSLKEALEYFRQPSEFDLKIEQGIIDSSDLNAGYLDKRKLLSEMSGDAGSLSTPAKFQQVIDLTSALKVLVR